MINDERQKNRETMMMMEHRYLRPAGRGSSMDEATLKREDAGVSRRQTNKQGAGWKIVGIQSITYFRCWGAGQHSQFHGQEVAIQVPSPNTGCVKRNYLVQHFFNFFCCSIYLLTIVNIIKSCLSELLRTVLAFLGVSSPPLSFSSQTTLDN